MKKDILDTNVLLRFLVGDVPAHKDQAMEWFDEARKRKRRITITPIVIAEASFVLESFYKQERGKIADALESFVSQRWLVVESRRELLALWSWYRTGLHFVDSFLLAYAMIKNTGVLTFDRKTTRNVMKS